MSPHPENADAHASRPHAPPSYGIAGAESGSLLPWSWVQERMANARNYWVVTTGPRGEPHPMPVWGVLMDGSFYFCTDANSRKAQNIARNPNIAVHLESGDEVVILQGLAQRVVDPRLMTDCLQLYNRKYDLALELDPESTATFTLLPKRAFAWREADFPQTATRWVFP